MSLESSSLTPSQDANRNAILEAARDLFARYGFKKTTMEDIAMALRKGKSSLYYYFKNKEEIFQAVIGLESEILFTKLNDVVKSEGNAQVKLRNYVIVRMETISELLNYQKVLKEDFYGDYEFWAPIKWRGRLWKKNLFSQFLKRVFVTVFSALKIQSLERQVLLLLFEGLRFPFSVVH